MRVTKPVTAIAIGHAINVRTKAIGQATENCFIQTPSHSIVGPSAIKDMMPDMESAIMKVISS